MAVDVFLQVGDIRGESQDKTFKNWIDVAGIAWGVNQSGTAHSGPGAGGGKVQVDNLTIHKAFDSASPNLLKHCCSGKHFGVAKLVIRKAGEKPLEYIKFEMKDGLIAHVGVTVTPGSEVVRESVTLNFASFKIEYTPQAATGGAGAVVPMQWNIATNSES
jgi:type VI secretion system secreted protein Hcp